MPLACLKGLLAIVAAAVVLVLIGVAALLSGLGDERLRLEAQRAVTTLAGDGYETSIGATRLSFDGLSTLALEVSGIQLTPGNADEDGIHIGVARFGLRFLPLLRGEISLGRMRIEDARIGLAAITQPGGEELALFDEHGLVDQDAVIAAVFAGAQHMASILDERDVDRIRMDNVALVSSDNGSSDIMNIVQARLLRTGAESFSLEAGLEILGRAATLTGELERDAMTGRIATLTVQMNVPAEDQEASTVLAEGHGIGSFSLDMTGSQVEGAEKLDVSARANGIDVDFDPERSERVQGDAELKASMQSGTGKIEINQLLVNSGRSAWRFNGAFGAAPEPGAGYRFELVSDGSTIAPGSSTEPPMQAVARLAGHLDASAKVLDISEIGVRSMNGEVRGSTVLRFEPGVTPGLHIRLDVERMPVGQAKQLWPWFASRSARNWVVANVFGGRVESGHIEIDTAPGRLNDGVPFGANEMKGEFEIAGTRFDTTGRIPPVRDGNGKVSILGTAIDISLQSGTVFMPGDRTVNASNGTLVLRDVSERPLIGKLKIDVAGQAEAIVQLARYDPIDVSRFVDIAPEELTGDVTGTITADIPFQRDTDIATLDWVVDLSYDNLNLARPFEGQTVSGAKGSIVLDPRKAVISATAKLNGSDASVNIVEPLGRSEVERVRKVALQMNDAARHALAPGLDDLISGSVRVELDDQEGAPRVIRASLDRALLNIPWVGWSKGSGVPANVAFTMENAGDSITISNFRLTGDTFSASGSLSLVNGAVRSLNFPTARLNRGDDFSVDLKRQGGGYAVTVRGASIDARSVVKLYERDGDGGSSGGAPAPVTVDLAVDTMTGFHGEVLRGVKLRYSGTGARTDHLEFSATTSSGRQLTFRDGRDGGVRTVSMNSADAGAVLRFLDIYEHMEGGQIALALRGNGSGPLSGQIDARDFWVVNEPRLRSLVASTPAGSERSLNQAVRGDIDTTRVQFERASSLIDKGDGYLRLERGVVRGPLIGSTFQGTLFDAAGNMDMTGTFMPAYGLNRIFGEIPLIGQILGNGRDRGLIGITFRLAGKSGEPQLQINPLSVIAPGIFRSVFEYR